MSKKWKIEISLLALFLVIFSLIAVWVFVWGSDNFDNAFHSFMMNFRSEFMDNFFIFFTTLASTYFIIPFVVISLIYLRNTNKSDYKNYFKHKKLNNLINHIMPWLIFALIVAIQSAIFMIFKSIFARPRPYEWFIVEQSGFSFPSGHTATAIVVYGLLAYIFSISSSKKWVKYVSCISASIICVIVGLSRIYLGVHYATDVLAGLFFGGIFLILGILLLKTFNTRVYLKNTK